MNFNEAQRLAIRHRDGPMLVLAGPGSGKTAVITERTRVLTDVYHISPSHILVITFTKAAADEMKNRFCRLSGQNRLSVTFGTFHAIFFAILKNAYHMGRENLVTEGQKYQLMREILSDQPVEHNDEANMIRGLLSEISRVKNCRLTPSDFVSGVVQEEIFCDIYKAYDRRLRQNRLMDFDDMLTLTEELLREREDYRRAWQDKFRYILIDEFQDINPVQYEVVRLLAAPENNLFIVGDDDQSIYRFRGSRPEIMLHFKEDYPDAKEVLLNYNYRCDGCTAEDSLRLIGRNKERFEKKIRTNKPKSTPVVYRTFPDCRQENEMISSLILSAVKGSEAGSEAITEGGNEKKKETGCAHFSDFAVLFRTNSQPRMLIEEFAKKNIPFRVRERVPDLYDHFIARDLFAYLRLARGGRRREDVLTVMNRPVRYIGRDSLPKDPVDFFEWEMFYRKKEQNQIADRIEKLASDLSVLSRLSPYAAINYIRKAVGYDEFLRAYAQEHGTDPEELFAVLTEFHEAARGIGGYRQWEEQIRSCRRALQEASRPQKELSDAVFLYTLHGAKGLEFPTVFILDADEGFMPYRSAVLPTDLEEERRMFYVGMTRAQGQLYVFSTESIGGRQMQPSRFIAEARGEDDQSSSSISSNSSSSMISSKRSQTASYSSSSVMLSREGTPRPSSR